jgi:hypothetical protein
MESQKPVIVIVPGAYHRPVHYRKIIDPLRAQGYEVLSFDLAVCGEGVDPELSFFDDAALIKEHLLPLLDKGKKAVIVSHSYGSLPVTALVDRQTVVERSEKGFKGGIAAVINIAGFVFPVRGKSIFGNEQNPPPPPYQIWKVSHDEMNCSIRDLTNIDPGWYCTSPRNGQIYLLFRSRSRGGRGRVGSPTQETNYKEHRNMASVRRE